MEATKKVSGKSAKKWLSENAIIVLMLAVSLIVGIIHPNFFAVANLINLFKNVSIRYIIALGISGCLITTGNDLSAGRLAGFAACLACIFAQTEGAAGKFYPNMPTLPTPVVFILVIAICAIVGLCNGLVVSYLKVQPFIATLGMQQVVYGICLVYTGGTPIGSLNKNFTSLASNTILKVPVLIWIALVVAVCFWFLYNKTRHGKYMYAIGGNEAAAEVAGVNVYATKIRIYILASCMFGLAGCLITTGNDLSAGRLAGFAACLACIFAQTEGASGKFYPNMPTLSTPVVFILVIAICAIVGLCNGLVVSYLKVQPFIATLGMQQVVYGICLVYTGGTPIGSLNSNFTALAKDTFLAIPVLIWFALIVAVCFWFLYNKTRHGKYMYAIGGNEAAAEVAGVNVNATKIRIYILASCMFGLAGCLLAAKSGGASVNTAQGYELDAIAACTIGGVSTTGGVGTVPGVLVGVLVFELMKVALQFMNVNSSYTYIVQGLVIIVAVAIDIRKYLAKK